ncbi:hypothetical protein E2I00_020174 [Balaenoptera physalus]|uniref:Macro domain-containing protein n=1 Tax=Balaenoptera physalus TaxID=9770 RepID=A0A643BRR5_BALPH|nr:hypothetical protein E2I00_020174 [Balaenoptera physalus]
MCFPAGKRGPPAAPATRHAGPGAGELVVFNLLLTGTPIQNSLRELYSLLSFVEPDLFSKEQVEDFIQRYQDIEKESESDAFENEMAKKVKLQNVLSQLRKCVDHPYLFDVALLYISRLKDQCIQGQLDFLFSSFKLSEILKFGLDKLLSSEGSTMDEIDLESILGETKDGQWISGALPTAEERSREQEEGQNHMYLFEGKDYSKEPSKEDRKSFEQLVNLEKTLLEKTSQEGRLLRNKGSVLIPGLVEGSTKRKRILSPEELEDRRKKRQEAAAKRKKLLEEKKRKKEEAEHKKKMAWWESNDYQSFCLPSEESEPEDLEDWEDERSAQLDYEDPDSTSIKYVSGDVTHPQAGAEDAVIVHCVDDSGRWGRGGLFTALEKRSAEPRKIYELAGKMKDLSLGGVLLFPIDDKESRNKGQDLLALIVAQHRDRANVLSGIKMAALDEGLKKIFLAAKKKKGKLFHLCSGIDEFLYYFPRSKAAILHPQASSSSLGQLVP